MFVCCLTAMSAKGTPYARSTSPDMWTLADMWSFAWEHIWIVLYKIVVMLHKNVEHKR